MYELYYTDEFKRDVKKLDGSMQTRLKKAIQRIMENPTHFKHLENGINQYRVRFDVYRILYKVVGNKVELIRLGKRDSDYE